MFLQRVITGVILAATFLSATFYLPVQWLAIAFGAVATAGAWEWALMAGLQHTILRLAYTLLLPVLLMALWLACGLGGEPLRSDVQPWLGVACLLWCFAMLLVESYPNGTWLWRGKSVRALMGMLLLSAAWLAMMFLTSLNNGRVTLVLLVVGVVAADVGAYFAGKRFGRHKLAPHVSPGKTWEGLWGGMAAVMLVTTVVWLYLPPAYMHLDMLSVFLIGLAVAGSSVLGDLTVSMVKRVSGVKDSGSILPGHGGLLDRLDSICGAAPFFALGLILVGY